MENFVYYFYQWFYPNEGILVTAKNAKKMLKNCEIQLIVDARSRAEWDNGHFKGARNIPLTGVSHVKFSELHENTGILVYCNNGSRASRMAATIMEYGFKYVYYINTSYWEIT